MDALSGPIDRHWSLNGYDRTQCHWRYRAFATAKKLVGYAGLGVRIHASGQIHKTGGTQSVKQERKELRAALVEAAWVAIRYDPHWQEQFDGLAPAQFIRYHLLQLDLGHDLDYVIRGNTKRRIAPVRRG